MLQFWFSAATRILVAVIQNPAFATAFVAGILIKQWNLWIVTQCTIAFTRKYSSSISGTRRAESVSRCVYCIVVRVLTWPTDYRGPLLIVSSKSPPIHPAGCAVAAATLVECRPMTRADE